MGKTFRRADKFDRFGKLTSRPRYGNDDGFDNMSRSRIQDKLQDYTRFGDHYDDDYDDLGDDYYDEDYDRD